MNMTRNNKSKLSHVWHWKELPDGELLSVEGYDALMVQCGKVAEEIEEGLAAVKAQLSIRAQRAKKA